MENRQTTIEPLYIRIPRMALAIILIAFGLNGYISFMPAPQPAGQALEFLKALAESGYVMHIVNAVLLGSGILLLIRKATLLALIVLFPISLNIVLFHIFIQFDGITIGLIMWIFNTWLLVASWNDLKVLLKP